MSEREKALNRERQRRYRQNYKNGLTGPRLCECGRVATVRRSADLMCQRCADMDQARARYEIRRLVSGSPVSGIPIYRCHAAGF
jgi:hypothetical protein